MQPGTTATVQPTDAGEEGESDQSLLESIANAPTRTPVPTSTPSALAEGITEFLQQTGLSDETLLWLSYADWINLAISLLIVFAGYLVGTWLTRWLFPRLIKRTKTTLDDQLLEAAGDQMRWLAVILTLRFAIDRLTFIPASFRALLTDILFYLILFFIM
jgi:hypothetical protein